MSDGQACAKLLCPEQSNAFHGKMGQQGKLAGMHCYNVLYAIQDKLFRGHQMSTFNQMLYVNICSALVSLTGVPTALFSNNARPYIQYEPIMLQHQSGFLLQSAICKIEPFFIKKPRGCMGVQRCTLVS